MLIRKGRWVGERRGSKYVAPVLVYDWSKVAHITIMDGAGKVLRVVEAREFKCQTKGLVIVKQIGYCQTHVKQSEVSGVCGAGEADRVADGGAGCIEEGIGGAGDCQ